MIKGGILAYQGAAALLEDMSDLVAEAAAEAGGEVTTQALDGAAQATGTTKPRRTGTRAEAGG